MISTSVSFFAGGKESLTQKSLKRNLIDTNGTENSSLNCAFQKQNSTSLSLVYLTSYNTKCLIYLSLK